MKKEELKRELTRFLNEMIDTYYANPTLGEKMLNYTLKVIVETNIDKADNMLELFTDKNGNIDADRIIHSYAEKMGNETISFNLRDYVENDFIKSMLPNKSLVISANDIASIIRNC